MRYYSAFIVHFSCYACTWMHCRTTCIPSEKLYAGAKTNPIHSFSRVVFHYVRLYILTFFSHSTVFGLSHLSINYVSISPSPFN